MNNPNNLVLVGAVLLLVALIPMMFYAVWLQKKALSKQEGAINSVGRSLQLQEQGIQQNEQLIVLHIETNALLRAMSAKPGSQSLPWEAEPADKANYDLER